MRLSTILLILLLLVIVGLANAQITIDGTSPKTAIPLFIKDSLARSSYQIEKVSISPVLLGEYRNKEPREIFFIIFPRLNESNYDCWVLINDRYVSKEFTGKVVDVDLMGTSYTFEELKKYLFYDKSH